MATPRQAHLRSVRHNEPEGVERFVRNGDIEIATYSHGDPTAPTVLLVHGWPDSHHLWDEVIPLLADDFHVVAYDTRGNGRTTNPRGTKRFAVAELASDLLAVADAMSPDQPVHVVGHDWGSMQSWEAMCEPGAERRIASFISISGPNLDHVGKWAHASLRHPSRPALRGPLAQLGASYYTFLFQVPGLSRVLLAPLRNERRWAYFLRRVEGTSPEHVHLGESFRDDMLQGTRIYRANILQKLFRPRDRVSKVPTLLIINKRDIAVLPYSYAGYGAWTERLWRLDLDTGHWLPYSHPDVIASAVRDVIRAVSGDECERLVQARVTD